MGFFNSLGDAIIPSIYRNYNPAGFVKGYIEPPRPPEPTAEEKQRMANEELLRKFQDRLYADEAAQMQTNYPVYRGPTQAKMSPMTQSARQMRQQRSVKGPSHGRKVQTMLSRPAQGFNDQQMRSLLDLLGTGPGNPQGMDATAQQLNQLRTGRTSQNQASDRMQKQFGSTYGYEPGLQQRLEGKITGDIGRRMGMTEANFRNLNENLANLEGHRANTIAGSLRNAGDIKDIRREGLTRQLEEFGNQQHAFENLKNQALRDSFDDEAMAPQRRIQLARQSLQGVNADEMHPDRMKAQNALLQQIQNAYDAPHANYPGQRVAGMEPETLKSFETAGRLSPKYRDVFHGDRKTMERNFMNPGNNVASQIYSGIPDNLAPMLQDLDYIGQQQFKKATKKIAGEHVRRGTYGSGAHKAETAKAMRSLARQMQMEREGALTGTIKSQGDIVGGREQNALSRYNMMAEHGGREFGDVLRNNALLNQLGWTKRGNRQADENEALKEWYRQMAYEWPHMKQNYMDIGKGGYNSMLGPFNNLATQYATDLSGLFAKPAAFSESQMAHNRYRNDADRDLQNYQAYLQRMNVG